MDNSAQYFHKVYRRVFQLSCVLHLEPENTLLDKARLTLTSDDFETKRWMAMPVDHVNSDEPGRHGVFQVRVTQANRITVSLEDLEIGRKNWVEN